MSNKKPNLWWAMWPTNIGADTAHLSHDEFGMLIRLMNHAWHHQCQVSGGHQLAARILGISKKRCLNIVASFGEFFSIDEEGKWVCKYLEKEWENALANSQKGRKAANARWEKRDAQAMHMHSTSNAHGMPTTPTPTTTLTKPPKPRESIPSVVSDIVGVA